MNTRTLRIGTALTWAGSIYSVQPYGPSLPIPALMVVLSAAIVGSLALVMRGCARPWDEVYLAGKEQGRREVECELASERVTRLDDRRSPLRAVGGGRQLR